MLRPSYRPTRALETHRAIAACGLYTAVMLLFALTAHRMVFAGIVALSSVLAFGAQPIGAADTLSASSVTESLTPAPPPPPPPDYALLNGHFYAQTNGAAGEATPGYSVTDEAGIPMWSEFQRWGGVEKLGYPVSRRFQLGHYIAQTFQKGILQWAPNERRGVLANVMDLLHDAGKDDVLQTSRQIPPQVGTFSDAGRSWDEVRQAHLKLLEFSNPGFQRTYDSVPDSLASFGLPTSPITDEGASYTIRLQRAAMQLWKSDQPWARANTVTLVNAGDLAKENGMIPSDAMKPEPGRIAWGESVRRPWSGWWWPSLDASDGPHLFDASGPLAKYDAYVRSLGQPDPHTRQWELEHFQFTDPTLDWAGKCNGSAVSALVEPEPTKPHTLNGITFTIADQKGLLADYHFADPAAFLVGSKDTAGVTAADFHRTILNYLGNLRQGLVINAFDGNDQVQSFAVYRFQAVYLPDPVAPTKKTHVKMTIWAADYHVDPNFVGLKNWPDDQLKTYSYFIYGDRANPTGGEWEGNSVAGPLAHPENLWYPDLNPATRNLFGQLTSPNLDYGIVRKIMSGG